MEREYFFEVFKDKGNDEGTETVETFDTEQEAKDYITKNSGQGLGYDKWSMNSDGSDVKQEPK
jgi:hypothetical protein